MSSPESERLDSEGLMMLFCVLNVVSLTPPGGRQDVGLHSASDRGGDTGEEEEETTGKSPPHTGEKPIKCLPARQDFQRWQVTVTLSWLWRTILLSLDFEQF